MYRALLVLLIVLLAGLQYRLWFGNPSVPQNWQLQQVIKQQAEQNEQLSERNKQLEAEVKDLKKGLSALEERARNELGMIRKGETFFQLVEPERQTP